jgi:hypothetical protein
MNIFGKTAVSVSFPQEYGAFFLFPKTEISYMRDASSGGKIIRK